MFVSDVLNEKGGAVETVAPEQTLASVVSQLADKGIGAVVVLDAAQKVAGILSERDIIRKLSESGARALDEPASSAMTENVVTCATTDTLDSLMAKMTSGRFRHMPVIADDKLAGIISIGDVVKRRIQETEQEAEALKQYIST